MEPEKLDFFRKLLNERLEALLSEAGATLGDLTNTCTPHAEIT